MSQLSEATDPGRTAVADRALLDVTGLRVIATAGPGDPVTLLDGIDLRVGPGESVAVVGESGSGKSLTTRAVVGLLPEGTAVAGGSVRLSGEEVLHLPERVRHALRGRRVTLLMQDPFTMLHPQVTCGRQIADGLRPDLPALAGATGRRARGAARRAEVAARLAEVGLGPETADRYPHELSGGMRQRVAAAAALAGDPELLIADEPTTALDAANQQAVLDLLRGLQRDRGMGLVLITHDLRVAFSSCDRVYVLYAGSVLEQGRSAELGAHPQHPYTQGLLQAEPSVRERYERLPVIPGSVPAPDGRGPGCPFADRCAHAAPVCRATLARLWPEAPDARQSACVRAAELGDRLGAPRPHTTAGPEHTPAPADAAPALRLQGVHRVFGSGAQRHTAVRDVSLSVPRGRVTALVGESGSGKTTLARIAVGLETFSAGDVEVGGVPLTPGRRPAGAERAALASRVQIVFQDPYSSLNPLRTVGATLREALAAAGRLDATGRRARAEQAAGLVAELLDQVGLPGHYATRRPGVLSGGERQRVAVARALAVRPELLICDEAVAALDVSVQAQLLNLLADLRRAEGFAVLFITHDLGVVRQIADDVAVMYRGELVEQGPAAEVLDRPRHDWTRRMLAAADG
ncbi:dipeptide ABC transporter ATP-binding protein [Streptomyces sp. NPDC059639]|uniref:ABC transporter ATP-binding protein n=1 Tax=Streptomyces sp. NPDC059639 TaxID=3346891 RepID=UPI0036CC8BC2